MRPLASDDLYCTSIVPPFINWGKFCAILLQFFPNHSCKVFNESVWKGLNEFVSHSLAQLKGDNWACWCSGSINTDGTMSTQVPLLLNLHQPDEALTRPHTLWTTPVPSISPSPLTSHRHAREQEVSQPNPPCTSSLTPAAPEGSTVQCVLHVVQPGCLCHCVDVQ